MVGSDLKVAKQCRKVVDTANRVLGMIYRIFTYRTSEVLLPLYKSLVRPHLEYCIQAWRPFLKKDIDLLEKVQRRATRMICDIQKLNYEDRLSYQGLTTLKTRRLRGDVIHAFKIVKESGGKELNNYFKLASNNLRGHSLKLCKPRCNLNVRKFAFSNRVVDEWNLLEQYVIDSSTTNTFKKNLGKYLTSWRGLYRSFRPSSP